MHEKIRTANRPLVCDVCGGMIQVGEPFRAVRDEYSPVEYHEHIQCPGSPAVAVSKPPPEPPKITAFNPHSHCMA